MTEHDYFVFVEHQRPMLAREASRILDLPPDAESVEYVVSGTIQDIWQKLFLLDRPIDTSDVAFPGYLRIAVRHDALDYMRNLPEEVALEDLGGQGDGDGYDILDTIIPSYTLPVGAIVDVQAALARLDPTERAIVWGVVVEGQTLLEAAQAVRLRHPNQAKRLLGTGLAKLRRLLWAYGERIPPRPGA